MTLVVPSNIFVKVVAADIRAGFFPFTSLLFPSQCRIFVYLSPFLFAAGREKEGGGGSILGSNGRTPVYRQGCLSERAAGFFPRMRSLEIAGKFSIRSQGGNGKFLFSRLCKKKRFLFGRCRRLRKQANSGGGKEILEFAQKTFLFFRFSGENARFSSFSYKKNLSRLSGEWRSFLFLFPCEKRSRHGKGKPWRHKEGGKGWKRRVECVHRIQCCQRLRYIAKRAIFWGPLR